MITGNWTFNSVDEEITRALQPFIPDRVFDTHAHIYRVADLGFPRPEIYEQGEAVVTVDVWRSHVGRLLGERRLTGGLFIPIPDFGPANGDGYNSIITRQNDFVTSQVNDDPDSRGLVLVSPAYPRGKVAGYLDNPRIVGFKPYHTFSEEEPTFQASLASYLPEWLWEMADQHGLIILLHIVKYRALADLDNQKEICTMCTRYPNAKLILAHAARGFNAQNTTAGLPALRGLENVWFDVAAVCEPLAIVAILREFGPGRLLWGSDFPVSEMRGKCVSVGDGFVWLEPTSLRWEDFSFSCRPTLVGLESLNALRIAADDFGINRQEVQDIFFTNASRLLGLANRCENPVYGSEGDRMPNVVNARD